MTPFILPPVRRADGSDQDPPTMMGRRPRSPLTRRKLSGCMVARWANRGTLRRDTPSILPHRLPKESLTMVAAVIFSNTQWTFWNVFLLFFLWIPLVMLWFFALFDVFQRQDIHGGAKALWALVILIFPWIGTLVYLIARP